MKKDVRSLGLRETHHLKRLLETARHLEEFWGKVEGRILIILSTLEEEVAGGAAVGIGEWYASCFLLPLLNVLYGDKHDISIALQTEAIDEDLLRNSNILLIGGPRTNKFTEEAIKILYRDGKTRLHFEGFELWKGNEKIGQRDAHTDYAIFLRYPSPWNEKKRAVVIAGSGTYGTYTMVSSLTDPDAISRIYGKVRGNCEFAVSVHRMSHLLGKSRYQFLVPNRPNEWLVNDDPSRQLFRFAAKEHALSLRTPRVQNTFEIAVMLAASCALGFSISLRFCTAYAALATLVTILAAGLFLQSATALILVSRERRWYRRVINHVLSKIGRYIE